MLRGAAPLVVVAALMTAGAFPARAAPVPPGAARARLTVEAGAIDRKNSPVSFALPDGLAQGGPFELRDSAGKRLPLQIQAADKQGHFVLPALGRGKQATFQVVEASPAPAAPGSGVEVKSEADHLVVTVQGAPVFHFRTKAPAPSAEVPARYTRAGYLHPVMSPGGVVVTDDSPGDHGHHHGIWTAWTVTEYQGKRLSFWGPEPGRSKNDLVSVGGLFGGEIAGGFTARLASSDLSVKPEKQILDSEWKVVVHRTSAGAGKAPYFLFDLEWTDKVVGDKPLQLLEYRYGGLGVRAQREWLDANKVAFLTSEGADRLAGENTRVRWVHIGGPVTASKGTRQVTSTAGLAVLVHPLNLRAPEPVRLNPGIPELCISPVKAGPLTIAPGRPYTARYRFVVSDGPASAPLLERLWRDYARAPVVKVEPPVAPRS
jgi:hypothetical protein